MVEREDLLQVSNTSCINLNFDHILYFVTTSEPKS
jgi:hypothetical protein